MKDHLELVCKSLGVICLCGGILCGVETLSHLLGPRMEMPLLASRLGGDPAAVGALNPLTSSN